MSSLAWQKVFIFINCFYVITFTMIIFVKWFLKKAKMLKSCFLLGANFSELVLIFYANFRHFSLILGVLRPFLVLLIVLGAIF